MRVVRRSAVVVGREVEREALQRAVADAAAGQPEAIFLVGESGIGKTRLLGAVIEDARRNGLTVGSARASSNTPIAFGLMAEAFRSALRGRNIERAPLAPFAAGLRLVLPEWPIDAQSTGLSDAQLHLLAVEGLVVLAREIARSEGMLLALDDLHAADAESLDALYYLVRSRVEGVLVVGATRPGEPEFASNARDQNTQIWELSALDDRELNALVTALLGASPPRELVADVAARTDGVPLLVEEVVEAHVRSGALHVDEKGASWRGGAGAVPANIAEMARARLDRLPPEQRGVIITAAVLEDFDATLLAQVAATTPSVVGDAISSAVDVGLVEAIGGTTDFRHAVVREGVVASALPHQVVSLHQRAVVARAGEPAGARHLLALGEHDEAAALLTRLALASLADHALLNAEALARAAADAASSANASDDANDALARVLVAEGRWSDAFKLDEGALDTVTRRERMATCALEFGQLDVASKLVARAAEAGDDSATLHVVAARIAFGLGDAAASLLEAEHALALSTEAADATSQCKALDAKARALDLARRRAEAISAFEQQAAVAQAAGLTAERVHALVSLGAFEIFEGRPPHRIREARDLAHSSGALVEAAWADFDLAAALGIQGHPADALEIVEPAIARCRALRLDVLPFLLVAAGATTGALGDGRADAFLDEADALAPVVEMAINTNSIRGDIALHTGRYDDAIVFYSRSTNAQLEMPGGTPSDGPVWLACALAAVERDDDAARALVVASEMPCFVRLSHRATLLGMTDALLRRDAEALDAQLASVELNMPFELALMRVLGAERIGGPKKARWLREALDIYDASDHVATARVRQLLRDAGGPVPRRRRASAAVPEALAQHGVTTREADVARLVARGLSNAEIAEQLFVSVRTVETHVSSLLAKLHADSRAQLIVLLTSPQPA
jgi:DNA-binding CsgD family transcriptional regulator/tetratricopeptide (TPR) repeat protein